MAAVSTGVLTPDKLYPGGTFLDPVTLNEDLILRDSTHDVRVAVDSNGQLTIAKSNGAGFTDLLAADLTAGAARFGFGAAPSGNFAATFGRAIKVLGGATFAGDVLPTTQGPVSPYSLGSPDALWYSINAAELRVQSLVADEATVTMGGRQVIGQGNILAVALGSNAATDTKIVLRKKTVAAGDILHFSGEATGFLVATEFMLVGANANGDFVGTTGTTRKSFRTVFVNAAGVVRYPVQSTTTPFGFAGILEGETVAYEFVVTRNYEVGQVPTATANGWPVDATVMNTGQPGQGMIDMYVANRLLGLTQTLDTGTFPTALAGPTIEFLQRTGTNAFDVESRTAVGRLDGTYDYAPQTASNASLYGIAAGKLTGNWFALDPVQGLRMMNGTLLVAGFDDNVFTFGVNTTHAVRFDALSGEFRMGAGFVYDDNTGVLTINGPSGGVGTTIDGSAVRTGYIRSQATWGAGLYVSELNLNTGAASFARGNLTWDTNGNLSVNRITATDGTIAAFVIAGTSITSDAFSLQSGVNARVVVGNAKFGLNVFGGNDGLLLNNDNYWFDDGSFLVGGATGIKYTTALGVVIGSAVLFQGRAVFGATTSTVGINDHATVAIYAGGTDPTTAPFRLTKTGALFATSVDLTGKITATDGAIGGFVIGLTTITSNGLVLTSGANASIAAGANVKLGLNVGGADKHGLYIDATNYWTNRTAAPGLLTEFRVGGTTGINFATGGNVEFGSNVAVTGNVKVTGEIGIYNGADMLARLAKTSASSAVFEIVSTQTITAGVANRFGARFYDKAGTGQKAWNMYHESVGGTAVKADADVFKTYDTGAKTSDKVATTNENGTTISGQTLPVVKTENRFLFTYEGNTQAAITKDGDFLTAGRVQIGLDDGAETRWGQMAHARMLRAVSMGGGIYRPQWFDGNMWRWLDLGNVAAETVTVNWGNIGSRPIIQVTGLGDNNPGSGGITGTLDLLNGNGTLRLELGSAAISEAEGNDRFLRFDVDQTVVFAGHAALTLAQVQTARKNLGLTLPINSIWYATAADTVATTSLTAFGRSLIDDADAATARTTLGLGALAVLAAVNDDTFNATGGKQLSVAKGGTGKTGVAANAMLFASATDVYSELVTTAFGRSFLPLADAAAGRALLVVPGKAVNETITGAWIFSAGVQINSTLGVTGLMTMSGAATVGTTLGVSGATTLQSTLAVTGVATFSDFVSNKAPDAPASLAAAVAGDTATLTIGRSPTYNVAGGVQQYTVLYRYDDEDDSRLRIAGRLAGFATATAPYVVTGLQRRRAVVFSVVAVKNGVDSLPVTTTVATASLPVIGDVTDVQVMAAPQHFEIRWKLPADARVGTVLLKVAKAASATPLNVSSDFAVVTNAAGVTAGVTFETIDLGVTESTEYRFQMATERNLQFRFWVETVARA